MLYKPLAKNNLSLYAGKEYLKKAGSLKHPKDIANHNCLTYQFNQGEVWTFEKDGKKWDIPTSSSFKASGSDLLAQAVHEQMGLALLPDWLPKDLRVIKHALPGYGVRIKTHKERVIHAIYSRNKRGHKLVRSILEKVKEAIG